MLIVPRFVVLLVVKIERLAADEGITFDAFANMKH